MIIVSHKLQDYCKEIEQPIDTILYKLSHLVTNKIKVGTNEFEYIPNPNADIQKLFNLMNCKLPKKLITRTY